MPYKTGLLDFSRPLVFMFDLDGTILDSTPWHMQAFRETLTKYAPRKLSELNEAGEDIIRGYGSKDVFLKLGFTDNKEISELVEHKRAIYRGFIQRGNVCLFPGVKDLINFLYSRYRTLILVTSSSNSTATLCLEVHELNEKFDYVVTGEQVASGKQTPDIFLSALKHAKLEPFQAITIEDSDIGIQASKAAGIPAVLVNQEKNCLNVPTFGSVTELYDRVRLDFDKSAPDKFSKAILLEQNVSSKITWDNNFGTEPEEYNSKSDQEIFNIFKLASEKNESIRLLRIGGPLLFRKMVVSYLEGKGDNRATKVLLDQRIPSIRFLIADPDGVPFLNRLDYEEAGTWGIWRVRYQTLRFAESLCELNRYRKKLEIGFHRGELIWNLGIVGETAILVRAYGSGTGHDTSVASRWMITGEKIFLAESFTNYWESITRREDTKWMKSELFKYIEGEPKWPSLYKGNAVLFSKKDLDKEDHETSVPKTYVPKLCRYGTRHEAEYKWVYLTKEQRENLKNLRPVRKAHPNEILPEPMPKASVLMEKLIGFSLFEIASEIRTNRQSQESRNEASRLLGEILFDTVEALKEFRDIAEKVTPKRSREPYQYDKQLEDALNEVKSFIGPILSTDFDNAIKDVKRLGKGLVSKASFPFRDAQLKNRIWVTNESISELVERLLKIDCSDLQLEMKNNLRDIDFETSDFKVTPWDDVIHILFFEKSGLFCYKQGTFTTSVDPIDPIEYYEDWWGKKVDDETGLWMTVLARSIREFCRRLWYARNMPKTYCRRYKHERRDYFLDLALYALQKLSNYKHIRDLLTAIKESPDIWPESIGNDDNNKDKDRFEIIPFHPKLKTQVKTNEIAGEEMNYDVFISYNSKDENDVMNLVEKFQQRGLKTWIDSNKILAGDYFQDCIQYAITHSKSGIVILGTHGLGKWQKSEIRVLIDRRVECGMPVIPVLLPGVDSIPLNQPFLKGLHYVMFTNGIGDEKMIDQIIYGINGEKLHT